jgi:hypothetical protein
MPCGAATVENIELRCRAHNAYEARLFFGPDVVREGERGGLDSFRNELTAFFRTVHQLIVGSGSV